LRRGGRFSGEDKAGLSKRVKVWRGEEKRSGEEEVAVGAMAFDGVAAEDLAVVWEGVARRTARWTRRD